MPALLALWRIPCLWYKQLVKSLSNNDPEHPKLTGASGIVGAEPSKHPNLSSIYDQPEVHSPKATASKSCGANEL